MSKAHISLANTTHLSAEANGAHVTSWQHEETEQLFVSRASKFGPGHAIRGGVPIIFPQFGAFGDGKRHGFARNSAWQREASEDEATLIYGLSDTAATREVWPHTFQAKFQAALEGNTLTMTLNVVNTGEQACTFTCALHTYFKVHDIRHTEIHGVQNCHYWDNNGSDFSERYVDERACFALDAAIDRIYFNTDRPITLKEDTQTRRIESIGFKDTVIWNPWEEGASALGDMETEEYRHMLCVEAAVVDEPITLESQATWTGKQIITVL